MWIAVLVGAALAGSETETVCRKCKDADFNRIDSCHLTGWVLESGNSTFMECTPEKICSFSDIRIIIAFGAICALFIVISRHRRKSLIHIRL